MVTVSSDGTVSFDPFTAYDSLDDGEDNTVMFSYQITDNDGNMASSIVSLKIKGEDDPMIDTAGSLTYTVNAADTLAIDGLFGIIDPDLSDNPLTLVSATSSSGAVSYSSDGDIIYTAPILSNSTGTNYGFRGTGQFTLSVDGVGVGAYNTLDSGFIQVEKPAGATVEAVYMLAMGDVATDYNPSASPVRIAGVVPVLSAEDEDYDASGFSSAHTQFGEVTSSLASTLNALPAGTSDLLVEELETLEGVNLFVVWNDPGAPTTSAAIWMGSQNTLNGASGSLLFDPIDTSSPDFEVTMGIGIGYSYNDPTTAAPEQVSRFRVNGSQIANRAGGYDDGLDGNGGLWTIGGLGDDPNAIDDELYDVTSYIDDGDTSIDWTADSVTGHDVDWINSVYAQARGASFAASASDLITLVIQNQDGDQITVTRQVAIR